MHPAAVCATNTFSNVQSVINATDSIVRPLTDLIHTYSLQQPTHHELRNADDQQR